MAALGVLALIAFSPFDLATIAARRATASLGRPLTIAALRVQFGTVVTIELRDLVLENAKGGSRPEMLRIARLDTEIAASSLLSWALSDRAPEVRRLSIDGYKLLLEHDSGDRPNWRFRDGSPSAGNQRSAIPTLLDARIHDAEVAIRTSSGRTLLVTVNDGRIETTGAGETVRLTTDGGYNSTPIQSIVAIPSFDALRDATKPVAVDIHLVSGDTTMDFAGTLADPLNADGADGRLALQAQSLDRLLAVAGIDARIALPLRLSGPASRHGDVWQMTDATGSLRGQTFNANLRLREGARHAPDDLTVDIGFTSLDLTDFPGPAGSGETGLRIDPEPGTLLDAHLTAKQFRYGAWRAEDVDLKAKLAPGKLSIEPLTMRLAGGTNRIDAVMENAKSATELRLDASLDGANVTQLSGLLGIGTVPLGGTIDARVHLVFTGNTLTEAGRRNRGAVILSMRGGSIERKVVEGASTDIRSLFRAPTGSDRIACLLGVLDLRDGIGRVAPLRIMTSTGTIAGTGTLDINNDTLDVTLGSESRSTGLFALDVPLRIFGPIRNPRVLPALGRAASLAGASADVRDMPPALQNFVRGNPCLVGGRR